MKYQLLALLGSVAHGVRLFVGSILSLVGLGRMGRFAVPVLAGLLLIGAVVSARDTAAILSTRPEVTEANLSEVAGHSAGSGASVWYAFDALIAADSLPTPADLGTFFYLARDPDDTSRGLLVRSALNDLFFRQRVLTADLVEDPDVVASALDAWGALPPGLRVDRSRYLDEVGSGGDATAAFVPSQLADEPAGESLLVAGRVVAPVTYGVCGSPDGCAGQGATWLYLLADAQGGDGLVLRSPHPPDAIPVRLEGLYLRDAFDLGPVLDSDWFAAIEAAVPTDRAFQAGSRPPITVPASWVPTIIYAGLALLLGASHLVGYPVFGPSRARPDPARSLASGEALDLAITGRLERDRATIQLDRSPGALERLSIPDLALRMWRYGLLSPELSRQEAERRYIEQAGRADDRLVVHERDQSALLLVEPGDHAGVSAGRLYRLGRSTPAVHLRHGRSDAYLELRSDSARDRAAAELKAEVGGRPPA